MTRLTLSRKVFHDNKEFETLDIDEPTVEPDSEPHPQTLPLWNSTSPRGVESHQTSLR